MSEYAFLNVVQSTRARKRILKMSLLTLLVHPPHISVSQKSVSEDMVLRDVQSRHLHISFLKI